MISLISMLVISIYSHVNSWLFQTAAATTTAIIPHVLQQQQLLAIRNVSSDISIPYQRNLNTNKQFKRIRLFSRLRQSPMTWTILSIAYAVYIILKVLQIHFSFYFLCRREIAKEIRIQWYIISNESLLFVAPLDFDPHASVVYIIQPKKKSFWLWTLLFAGVGWGRRATFCVVEDQFKRRIII